MEYSSIKIQEQDLQHNMLLYIKLKGGEEIKGYYFKRYMAHTGDARKPQAYATQLSELTTRYNTTVDKCYIFMTNSQQDSNQQNKINASTKSILMNEIMSIEAIPYGPILPFIVQLQDRVAYLEDRIIKIVKTVNSHKEKLSGSSHSQHKKH